MAPNYVFTKAQYTTHNKCMHLKLENSFIEKQHPINQLCFSKIHYKQLNLMQNPKDIKQSLEQLANSGNLKNITSLYLQFQALTEDDLDVFSKYSWQHLKNLLLASNCLILVNPLIQSNFSRLEELSLANNTIQSIQSLCRIRLPQLKNLSLKHNNITSLKQIRKIQSQLTQFSFYRNPIKDCQQYLYQTKLQEVISMDIQYSNNKVISQNIGYLCKMYMPNIKKIINKSLLRINQSLFLSKIKQKYTETEF